MLQSKKDLWFYCLLIFILIVIIVIILIIKICKKERLIDKLSNKIVKIDKNISECELYSNIKAIILDEKLNYGKNYTSIIMAQVNENDALQYLSIGISLIALIISMSSLLCEIFDIAKTSVLYELIFFISVFLCEYYYKFHSLGKYQNYIKEIISSL